jgi:hypothetical protein
MKTAAYGSLPFDAQIAFFRNKLAMPSTAWSDVWQGNHDHAFVVAGAMKMALVEDLQAAVQQAIAEGTTIAEFRQRFDAAVAEHGWSYKGNHGWRTRVIYETNMRTSHAAGRYTQLQRMPYWQYHHASGVNNPRHQHLAWSGIVLAKDDPFWQTHYPPNGWGCRCYVTGMSKARMQRKGLQVAESPAVITRRVKVGKQVLDVPDGIDAGWAYAPGRSAWMHAHVPPATGEAPHGFAQLIPATAAQDLLPEPQTVAAEQLLPAMKDGEEEAYARQFLQAFDADIGKPVVFTDAAGEAVVISEALLKDVRGRWKIAKRGRERFLLMMADAIKNPDEIWVGMEWMHSQKRAVVRRRYVSRRLIDGVDKTAFTVFEFATDGWRGKTSYVLDHAVDELSDEVEGLRRGVRLYRRGE